MLFLNIGGLWIIQNRSAWHRGCICGRTAHFNFNPSPTNPLAAMLETVAIILVVMWLLGMISSYTVGGYIHLLLAVALVTVIIRLIRGRDPLK